MTIRTSLWLGLCIAIVLILVPLGILFSRTPKADADWSTDQSRAPEITLNGNQAIVQNVRDFTFRTEEDYDVKYIDTTIDMTSITGIWLAVDRFSTREAIAHTFISIEFANTDPLVISVEARREKGETYSPVKGMFRTYELLYSMGTERDYIRRAILSRKHPLTFYKLHIDAQYLEPFLRELFEQANTVRENPRFYHTLFSSCTTELIQQANAVSNNAMPFSIWSYAPGYADALAYDWGYLGNTMTLEELRKTHSLNERVAQCPDNAEFSKCIREGL